MLPSGVQTQTISPDSSMPAVVQELYSKLAVSVSTELYAEREPSMIPDIKAGASGSHVSQSRASPLQLQRTSAEGCCDETSETLDCGGETGWCGLVDPIARGPVAFEISDRKERTKNMEPKVFREQRDPCEGAKENPCQHSTATREKICPSQDVLQMQSSKEPVCVLPGDLLKNKGNVHNTTGILPESIEDIQGNCAVSKMDRGEEELCDLNLVCEADGSRQQILKHCKEKHSSAYDISTTSGSKDSINPTEENSKMLYLTSYLSGPKSLEKCSFENSGLIKESAEKIHKVVDESKNFTHGEESEQYWRPRSEGGGLFLLHVRQQEQDGSGEKQTVESSSHSSLCTPSSSCTENCNSMPNSFTEATEIMFRKNDLKITLNIQGNLVNPEDHRETVTDVNHPERHSEESSFSLLVHIAEPEQTTGKSSAVNEKTHSKDSKSVVRIQRSLGDSLPNEASCTDFLSGRKSLQNLIPADPVSSEHNEISKPKKGTAKLPPCPEFDCGPASEKHVQASEDISHLDEPAIACEMSEPPCNSELVVRKIEHECALNQQVSLNSQEHVTLPTYSLLNLNREMPSATCKDAQQSHHTQTIPAERKLEAMSPQGDKTCGASSSIHTLNIKINPEGQKEKAGSGIKDLHSTFLSSVKEAAGFSFDTECQNVQSQDISSCQYVPRNASEKNMCSACAVLGPRKDTLKVSDCKVQSGNACQSSSHCFQRPEDFVEDSTFLERKPAGRETQSSILGGRIRSEMIAGMSDSGALNITTHAASHVEASEEEQGKEKQDKYKSTAVYKHSTSACDTQGLNQSTNIPGPDTPEDWSLTVISSHFKTMYQTAESLDQKADEVSNCQINQNSSDKCRREDKPDWEGLSGDHQESIPEVNHNGKDLTVSSGCKNSVFCGSLEIKDPKGAFENSPGSEALTHSVLDVVCPHCTDEPTEGVLDVEASSLAGHSTRGNRLEHHETLRSTSSPRGKMNVVCIATADQDSELPSAAAPTVDSSEIRKSHEEKGCRSLKDCEMEECPHSVIDHEVESVASHEPNIRALDRQDMSSNYCEHQGKGGAGTGLRLEANSEFGEKKTFGLFSKDLLSSRCPGSVEMEHSCASSQHSPAAVHGEIPKLKHLFKPKDGKMLHENVKDCTVQSDMKEGVPAGICNSSEGDGTHISVGKNVCKACRSHENSINEHLPLIMETAIKVKKKETEEHQKEPLGHLPLGEESEETIARKGRDSNFPKNSQTHLKCHTVQDVAENLHGQKVVEYALPKEEHTYQKSMPALLEQRMSLNMSDEVQNKQPVADQNEFIVMEEVILRKPTKKKIARQLQGLEEPKKESLCHLLKKDIELQTGPRLPGTSRKEHNASSAGGDQIHGAFVSLSYQQRLLPIKKQPHRTCKRIACLEPVTVRRKVSKVRNSGCEKSSSNPIRTKTDRLLSPYAVPAAPLEPEVVPSKSLCGHIPKPKATLCHPLRSLSCRKPTKESALLNKLSVLASKLVLATKPQKLRYRRYSSSPVPLAKSYKRLRYKKLLDGFSCNAMQLDPYLAATRRDKSNSKPMALYSLEAVKMNFIDLSNKMPALLFGTEIFPFSFHVKSASSCMVESSRTFPEHCAPSRLALAEASQCSSSPPKWTFSFVMSHGCPGMATFREDAGLCSQTHSQASPQTTAPLQDYGGTAIVQNGEHCSVLGLHTLLALCSPGCYRIWTKKRNFSNHMPTVQRFFLSQFTQGLKGLRSSASLADKVFCSLPYSVGRVLSIWSQHGPSCTLQLPALHFTHSKQQGNLSTLSSCATPNVPLLGMEAIPNTNSSYLRLEPVFPALVPKPCLVTEPAVSKLLLSASEFQVPGFDELGDVSAPCPRPQSSPEEQKEAETEKRPKKVSQIRIRKTIPKPDPNLTPMGLPRPKSKQDSNKGHYPIQTLAVSERGRALRSSAIFMASHLESLLPGRPGNYELKF